MLSRRTLLHALPLLPAALGPRAARAADEAWPQQPLRLITGGAGSVPDLRARWLGERLAPLLGQPVVVENLPAAGGTVAAQRVAHAAPDGYTLLMLTQGQATINPHLFDKPGYDPLVDLQPVARFGVGPLAVLVSAASPLRSLRDLAEAGATRPGGLNFGSPGIGTPPHLASELMLQGLRATGTHVPYNGNGRLMSALLGGTEVDWALEGFIAALPHVRAGRLRALAVTAPQRSPALPEVPTVAEAGVPGFEYLGWTGLAAPAGTPAPRVQRLNAAVQQVAAAPEARQWFDNLGSEPGLLTPEAFAAAIRTEHARWAALIRARGIKPAG